MKRKSGFKVRYCGNLQVLAGVTAKRGGYLDDKNDKRATLFLTLVDAKGAVRRSIAHWNRANEGANEKASDYKIERV